MGIMSQSFTSKCNDRIRVCRFDGQTVEPQRIRVLFVLFVARQARNRFINQTKNDQIAFGQSSKGRIQDNSLDFNIPRGNLLRLQIKELPGFLK